MALGLVSYGLSYGISALSGNIYLNFFLFAVTTIPTKAISMWLSNKYVQILLYLQIEIFQHF